MAVEEAADERRGEYPNESAKAVEENDMLARYAQIAREKIDERCNANRLTGDRHKDPDCRCPQHSPTAVQTIPHDNAAVELTRDVTG
jgi:hypothetical protein